MDVIVGDVNDNRPVFEQATYDVAVSEDWTPRSLLTVRAVDVDDDSALTYRFTDRTSDHYGHLFTVDRHTGLVTLTHSVDYEQIRSEPSVHVSIRLM